VFATLGVGRLVSDAVNSSMNFETTQVAFTGLFGSLDVATAKLKELQVFAQKTPFEFPELADAAKKLLAVGFDADRIIPIMTQLGNAAAAVGAKGYDINLVVRALGQIKGKGRLMSEEVNQIAEALPGFQPLRAIAEQTGIAFEDLQTAIGKPGGLLKAFGIDGSQAVDMILKGMEKIPGAEGAMERQNKTLYGSLSNLRDAFHQLAIATLVPFFPAIANFILTKVVPAVQSLQNVLPGLARSFVANLKRAYDAVALFVDAFRNGTDAPNSFFDNLGRAARTGWEVIKAAADGIQQAIEAVGAGFRTGRKDIYDSGFLSIFDDIGVAIRNFFLGLSGKVSGDFDQPFVKLGIAIHNAYVFVKDELGKLKDQFPGFWDGVTGAAKGDFDQKFVALGVSIHGVYEKVKEFIDYIELHKDTFDAIGAGVLAFAGALVTLRKASTGVTLLSNALGLLAPLLPALLSPVGLVALAIGALAAAFVLAYEKVPVFKAAVDSVIAAFKEGGLGAAAQEAGRQLGMLWDYFWPGFQQFLTRIPAILGGLVQSLYDNVLVPLGAWIRDTAAPWLGEQLSTWAHAFADWVNEKALPWLAEKLPVLLENIASWIRDVGYPWLVEQLVTWAHAFSDWVQEKALPWLAEKLPIILSAIEDWITGTVLPALAEFAKNMAIEILKFAAETAVNIPGEAAKITAQILAWAASLPGQSLQLMLDFGRALIEGIKNGATDAIYLLNDIGTSVFNEVTDAMSGAGSWLWDAGWQLIQGMISGIRAAAGAVASAARSVVEGAVNAAKSALHIGSPSKVFMEIGQQTGEGFVLGVEKTRADVTGVFGSILPPMIGAATYAASNYAASMPDNSATGWGSPTINIYAPLGVDRQEVIASVQQGLRQYSSARSSTRGSY